MKMLVEILECKVLPTQDILVEVSFKVTEGDPDYVEVYAHFGEETHAKVDIKISEGESEYKTTLKLFLSNTLYTIACCPRKIDSDGEKMDYYMEDGTKVYWESYFVYKKIIIPFRTSNPDEEFPAPVITHTTTYPKKIFSKSGVVIKWVSQRNYSTYELLIRKQGNQLYDIIPFKVSVNARAFNLNSQKLHYATIDFIMSNPVEPNTFEIQLRGILPAFFPLPTYYSKWSNVFSFPSATPLISVKAFFDGSSLRSGIKKYLPQNDIVSLKNVMQVDEIE